MTTKEWIEQARENAIPLRELLQGYHPRSNYRPKGLMIEVAGEDVEVELRHPITAPNAERACEAVREEIRKKEGDDPLVEFDSALATEDIGKLTCLLNEAWFGVPESTSCWRIPGFHEAVELLDDPPEQEYAEGGNGQEGETQHVS